MRNPPLSRFWLLLLAAGSSAAAGVGRTSPPDFPFAFPEIRFPIPKLHIITATIPRPSLKPLRIWHPEINLSFGCGGVFDLPELGFPAHGLIDLFGSVEEYRAALAAQTVEVVELQPVAEPFTTPSERAGSAVTLPEEDAAALRAVLTYDAAYDWKAASPLPASHGYRVKFKASDKVVSLDIFFSTRCANAPSLRRVPPYVRFDFGYATIASIVSRHFPSATD